MDDFIILIVAIIIAITTSLLCKKFKSKFPQYIGSKVLWYIFLYPLLFPVYCLLLHYINQTILTRMVMFVDSLWKPSTYTPFLGDLGEIIDFADQNGWLPDIGTSPQVREMSSIIASSNVIVGLGLLAIVILICIGFYRTFHLEEYSIRSIFLFHLVASVVLIIISIIFTLKAIEINDDALWYSFPVMAVALALVFIKRYYNALKLLKEKEENPKQIESVEETKEPLKENIETKKKQPASIIPDDDESSSSRFWLVLGSIVIVGFIGFLYWQYNNNTNSYQDNVTSRPDEIKFENYEEKSETIISQLTGIYGDKINVLYKYPELSKYCAFSLTENETEYLLIYDLEQEVLKRFENYSLQTINAGEVCLPYYSLSINENNDKILIQGNNGANSTGYAEYILELNPLDWSIREICSGREITRQGDGYKVNRIIMTKWITCNADSEYANIDIYYDLNGKPIPSPFKGESYQFKGDIDNKYAVTMQLSICDDKIYGEYYYDKYDSENKLYLYGGISSGRDIVLLEFNNKGEQSGTFKGKFSRDSFYGTFVNYQNKEMPFELYLK